MLPSIAEAGADILFIAEVHRYAVVYVLFAHIGQPLKCTLFLSACELAVHCDATGKNDRRNLLVDDDFHH